MEDNFKIIGIGILALGLIILVAYLGYVNQKRWDEFSKTHHCKVIAMTEDRTVTTILTDGKLGTTYVPGTKTYTCDDGIQYTRNN